LQRWLESAGDLYFFLEKGCEFGLPRNQENGRKFNFSWEKQTKKKAPPFQGGKAKIPFIGTFSA